MPIDGGSASVDVVAMISWNAARLNACARPLRSTSSPPLPIRSSSAPPADGSRCPEITPLRAPASRATSASGISRAISVGPRPGGNRQRNDVAIFLAVGELRGDHGQQHGFVAGPDGAPVEQADRRQGSAAPCEPALPLEKRRQVLPLEQLARRALEQAPPIGPQQQRRLVEHHVIGRSGSGLAVIGDGGSRRNNSQ